MTKLTHITLMATLVGTLVVASSATGLARRGPKILQFDTMVGVPATLTGTLSQIPLRGISGGGLPWTISDASGQLRANGHLEIEVEGLVLAAGPNAGSNPIASFRGLVSCVNGDGTITNILTEPFPATTGPASSGGGNAEIEANLTLPQSCIAPIVFVTTPSGAWLAASGK